MAHEKWQTQQIQAAVAIGVNPLDAAKAAKWVIDHLPPGADPNTYVIPAAQLEQDLTAPEITQDAVSAWVAREDVPSQWKLIVVAGEQSE